MDTRCDFVAGKGIFFLKEINIKLSTWPLNKCEWNVWNGIASMPKLFTKKVE